MSTFTPYSDKAEKQTDLVMIQEEIIPVWHTPRTNWRKTLKTYLIGLFALALILSALGTHYQLFTLPHPSSEVSTSMFRPKGWIIAQFPVEKCNVKPTLLNGTSTADCRPWNSSVVSVGFRSTPKGQWGACLYFEEDCTNSANIFPIEDTKCENVGGEGYVPITSYKVVELSGLGTLCERMEELY